MIARKVQLHTVLCGMCHRHAATAGDTERDAKPPPTSAIELQTFHGLVTFQASAAPCDRSEIARASLSPNTSGCRLAQTFPFKNKYLELSFKKTILTVNGRGRTCVLLCSSVCGRADIRGLISFKLCMETLI